MRVPRTLPSGILKETYQDEPAGCGETPGSVLMRKVSLTLPSAANFWLSWNDKRSIPGPAGVTTRPRAALVSPAASFNLVTPGSAHKFSSGGPTIGTTSVQKEPSPTPLTAVTR